MTTKILIRTFLIASIFGCASCKKSAPQKTIVDIPTVPDVENPVNDGKFVDSKTPSAVQPYILNANNEPQTKVSTADAPNGYTILFSDEFNAAALDQQKWNITVSDKTRDPRTDKGINNWFWKTEQVALDGSALLLKANKQNANTLYCGSIDSKLKFESRFGYYEVRIDNADIEKAVHTAFWMQGANQGNVDGSGNDGCEVDIFESAYSKGSHTQTALHWDGYGAKAAGWTKHWDNVGSYGNDIHDGYHVIGMEWTPTSMRFYYDGVRMFDYVGVGLPLVKQFLWLSAGASFGDGDFKSRDIGFLTQAKVDWVRVYVKNP